MTIFALEQAVSNGCHLDLIDTESALKEVTALRDENDRLKNDAAIFYEAAAGLLATNDTLRAELAEQFRELIAKGLSAPAWSWSATTRSTSTRRSAQSIGSTASGFWN